LRKLSKNDCRNQVAADYEEHIDAYKAAAKRLKASVEQYDWQHSKRPKSVYLSSVVDSLQCVFGAWSGVDARPDRALAKL